MGDNTVVHLAVLLDAQPVQEPQSLGDVQVIAQFERRHKVRDACLSLHDVNNYNEVWVHRRAYVTDVGLKRFFTPCWTESYWRDGFGVISCYQTASVAVVVMN